MSMNTKRSALGFTLIEIMVVVAVIAILASIAYPSYQESIRKTRRGAATGCMQEAAQQMERRYTTSLTYNATTTFPSLGCETSLNGIYTLGFVGGEPTATTFRMNAIPQAGQTNDGCGTLGLNQLGVKTISGSSPHTVATCWK